MLKVAVGLFCPPPVLGRVKNPITLAVKKFPRSLNLINNLPRNWKNK